MNTSFLFSLHFVWILLVLSNLAIQIIYFRNDQNKSFFIGKKITTPLLLFFGLAIVMLEAKSFPLVPGAILAAMGLGEIGIEGSSVVQSNESEESSTEGTSIIVTLAGVLFLLVNVFIGIILIHENGLSKMTALGAVISMVCFLVIYLLVIKKFAPDSGKRMQIALYLIGVIILSTGTLTDVFSGISRLGIAAMILTVSDTLVLIRMGADFDKRTVQGYRTLLGFLVSILLLYYVYIGVLIRIKSPFVF